MLKALLKTSCTIVAISGLLQFLLIPAVIWNVLYPITIISTFILGLYVWKNRAGRYLKLCFFLLISIFILEIINKVFLEEGLQNAADPIELKVMSYNLFFKNKRLSSSLAIIKEANPDILFVQELTPIWANAIENKLGKSYPYKIIKPLRGTHGIGIYSKYKLTGSKTLNNSSQKPYAIVTDLSIPNKKIQLINTHLASPAIAVENKGRFIPLYSSNYKLRKKQLSEINKLATEKSSYYDCQLLIGDLNTTKYEPIYKSLKWNWVDTFDKSGSGFGFNFPHTNTIIPFLTLDYILAKGSGRCIESKVIQGGSSDHLALISTIQI